jgi:Tfp pilus assembly protein PilZ
MPDGRMHASGHILNISLGGVFIEMENPPGFGNELDLEFTLPDTTMKCRGLVVWSTKTSPERAGGRSGIGVRLMKIGVAEMRILDQYIAERLEAT